MIKILTLILKCTIAELNQLDFGIHFQTNSIKYKIT